MMSKPKVIILGGGVAGMSAAHELAERGYSVDVYEHREAMGGKAKSINQNYGTDNKPHLPDEKPLEKPIPAEHGFRFFPGFYQHITDTMKRIPFEDKKTVYDNLVDCPIGMIARYNNKPIKFPTKFPRIWEAVNFYRGLKQSGLQLNPGEIKLFALKVWQLMTSCTARKNIEYESITWWDFMECDKPGKSDSYLSVFATGLTRTLVAAQAKLMSTKTGGNVFIQLIYDILKPRSSADRVLNGPTSVKWIEPWQKYLHEKHNVQFYDSSKLVGLDVKEGKISGARIKNLTNDPKGDDSCIYILALPIEDAAVIVNQNPELKKLEPAFEKFDALAKKVSWMTGIQFYITEEMDINKGHVIYSDTEWALTSISQLQFWDKEWVEENIDKRIKHILSVDVSDWDSQSTTTSTSARQNTGEKLKDEIINQLNQSLKACNKVEFNDNGDKKNILTYFLDRSIHREAKEKYNEYKDYYSNLDAEISDYITLNEEPLLVNQVNTWDLRPEAVTKIPNLFLAADYVKTVTDLATMEAANEAARNAVNGIIDFTNDDGMKGKCETKKLYRPWLFKLMHVVDNWRYKRKLNYSFKWTIIIAVLLIPIILIYLLFSIADAIIFFPQFAYHSFKSTKSDIPGC